MIKPEYCGKHFLLPRMHGRMPERLVNHATPFQSAVEFVIRPNQSLSPRGNRLFFICMAILSLTIAGGFAAMGWWLILPFAGLELLVLGLALGWCCHRARRLEIIRISGETVEVRYWQPRRTHCARLARSWTRVTLEPGASTAHPTSLFLDAHPQHLPVGTYLTDPERASLARALRRALPMETVCA